MPGYPLAWDVGACESGWLWERTLDGEYSLPDMSADVLAGKLRRAEQQRLGPEGGRAGRQAVAVLPDWWTIG